MALDRIQSKMVKRLPERPLVKGDDAVCVWCNRCIFVYRRFEYKSRRYSDGKYIGTGETVIACNEEHAFQAFDKPHLLPRQGGLTE